MPVTADVQTAAPLVALDATALAAALNGPGPARELLEAGALNRIRLVLSQTVVDDAQPLTDEPPPRPVHGIDDEETPAGELQPPLDLLRGYYGAAVSEPPRWVLDTGTSVVPEPGASAVAAAIHAGAQFLVTISQDLLAHGQEVRSAFELEVGTPEALLPIILAEAPLPAPRRKRASPTTSTRQVR